MKQMSYSQDAARSLRKKGYDVYNPPERHRWKGFRIRGQAGQRHLKNISGVPQRVKNALAAEGVDTINDLLDHCEDKDSIARPGLHCLINLSQVGEKHLKSTREALRSSGYSPELFITD